MRALRLIAALGLIAALAVAGWLAPAPALALTFVLESGETIEGAIVQATRNTVVVRPRLGGLRQIPVGRLAQLAITTADGQRLRGRYHGWVDGRCGLAIGSELLWLEDDRVVARTALAGPALAESRPAAPDAAAGAAAMAPAVEAALPLPALPADAPAPPTSPGGPAEALPLPAMAPDSARPSELAAAAVMAPLPPLKAPPEPAPEPAREPAAAPETVALPAPDLPIVSVKATPEEVSESSGEIVFTIELSRPVDDLLVVIYSTVDGTARSGADYEPVQGILSLPAGVVSQQVRTRVIDDADGEGDEDFQLFLATNPDLTQIAERWTQVTIHDDD